LALGLFTGACSSDKGTGKSVAARATAAADASGAAVGSDSLTLALPDHGFQLRTIGTEIEAGQDTEYCEVVALPGAESQIYDVSEIEIEMVKHSHHLIVSGVDEALPKYADLRVGEVTHCIGAQELTGIAGATMVAGSQKDHFVVKYPPGVGLEFHGGQKLIFDYHYFNTEDAPIHTGHRLNFHTVGSLEHIGKTLGFYNFSINTPPGQKGAFVGECRFSDDVVVGGLTRHTHQWGKDFTVWNAGGPDDTRKLWTSTEYEADTEYSFATPVLMKKDTGFRFECDYQNDTDRTLRFGIKATDEMCILFGLYWAPGAAPVARQGCMMRSVDADGIARAGALPAGLGGSSDAGSP
jgi:hypothetical protein